jgi:hypothetical protein
MASLGRGASPDPYATAEESAVERVVADSVDLGAEEVFENAKMPLEGVGGSAGIVRSACVEDFCVPLPLGRVGDFLADTSQCRAESLGRLEGGLARPSDDGGRDELREFCANRSSTVSASRSATRCPSRSIAAACSTTSAASCSYDGRRDTQPRSPRPDGTLPHLNSHLRRGFSSFGDDGHRAAPGARELFGNSASGFWRSASLLSPLACPGVPRSRGRSCRTVFGGCVPPQQPPLATIEASSARVVAPLVHV